ncbi:MAG TPA: YihY/virulence factor BrkB family protein [Nocardioidaceae bacterium]|nr:YihY/virulence factor BrkB family protein [Nocardioidaceae bacterium]
MAEQAEGSAPVGRSFTAEARHTAWRLVVSTVGICFRNRVTGLAAEAAFFALLSLPPLIFGLAGSIGYVFRQFSSAELSDFRANVLDLARQVFTDETVSKVIRPTLDDVLAQGLRFDVISIGFVLALWSGSRALHVIVDTITIMYGLNGHRGIVRARVLSFTLYVMGLLTGIVTIPLILAGPGLVDEAVTERLDWLVSLYWPIVLVLGVCFLATLYHVSVPVRTSWRYNLPGSILTMVVWILGSYVLRWFLVVTAGESTSIYGPLAAPIAIMLWLYLVSIAVLIGAALNASFDHIWPEVATLQARREIRRKLRLDNVMHRLRRDEES